jgi:HEAT repeat protein
LPEEPNTPDQQSIESTPQNAESDVSPQEVPRSRLITQFVVFPLAIVLVGVSIYLFLGILTSDNRSASDYLNTIRRGGINSRWQAAYELVKVLSLEQRDGTLDPRFGDEIVRVFEASEHDDPRVRRYLVRAMEMVDSPIVVAALISALGDADEETRLYAIHSLGGLRAESSVDSLLRFARDEDPGFRKSAVYALGQMQDPRIVGTLKEALHDRQPDVRWNAALQLARRGDTTGEPVLGKMMHRPFLASLESVSEDQKVTAIVYAVKAVGALKLERLKDHVVSLKTEDPSMKVRQAAIDALEGWEGP